jgi:hypothetical protein
MPNRNVKQVSVATPAVALQTETSLRGTLRAQIDAANLPDSPMDSKPRRVKTVTGETPKTVENTQTVAPGATKGNVGA